MAETMKCRSCGIEIADKAIVCFRCGTPTLDLPPVARAVPDRGRGRSIRGLVIAAVVVAAGIALVVAFVGFWGKLTG